jgi:hypothetical protein
MQAPAEWAQVENGALRAGHEAFHFAIQPFACHNVGCNRLDEGGAHPRGDKPPRSRPELGSSEIKGQKPPAGCVDEEQVFSE